MSFIGNQLSRLYELDRVENALWQILTNQGIPAQQKRDADTNTTPRVELELSATPVLGRRHEVPGILETQFLPYNTWTFRLTAAVVTNREQNGDSHTPLVGIARWNMQMNTFLQTWTVAICPTHLMLDIREEGCEANVWDEGGLDTSTMTFTGMFCIRKNAWLTS